MLQKRHWAGGILCLTLACGPLFAQTSQDGAPSSAPMVLTLKRSIELALENSKDIQMAKIQARVADNSANLTRAEFLPNLYAGSGAGYT
jgi:outer membrane protein TolC